MNTLYITRSGKVMLDENNKPSAFNSSIRSIDDIFTIKEDTKVVFDRGETSTELYAKEGDMVITFYNEDFPNKAIVINSKEWFENIKANNEAEQKRKEEWAAKKANADSNPCDCRNECSGPF